MTFTRKIEDFTCEHCGAEVTGNGYTNHCPKCLWSKHVDVEPGDRAELCSGMMEPIRVEKKGDAWSITQRCARCGFERRQNADAKDNFQKIVELSVV